MAGLMEGKKGLILGLANDKSIAWGIASELHKHGAKLAFTFQGEALEKRVRPLAASIGEDLVLPCDVTDEKTMDEHLDYNIGGYDLVFVARGMTPRLKSWQLSSIVAKLFAQAGLPDKAKQPDAPLPATLPPARKKPAADEKAKA